MHQICLIPNSKVSTWNILHPVLSKQQSFLLQRKRITLLAKVSPQFLGSGGTKYFLQKFGSECLIVYKVTLYKMLWCSWKSACFFFLLASKSLHSTSDFNKSFF
jgi:hypothetical protein